MKLEQPYGARPSIARTGRALAAMLLAAALFLAGALAQPARAQTSAGANPGQDPLKIAFGVFPPYAYFDETGARVGFSVDLADAIGDEIGVAVRFVEFGDAASFVRGLTTGAAEAFPGIARLPVLEGAAEFSDPVAAETLRLMVPAAAPSAEADAALEGLRIGIVPPAVGSHIEALRAANTVTEFASPDGAVMALLAGELDGVLAPNPTLFARARAAEFDGKIKFRDPPVREIDRVVALHESRADLMPAINAAIARMTADGRLAALRAKYFIDLPKPAPARLRVAVAHSPPWVSIEAGAVSGYAPELIQELAARAGVAVDFTPMSLEQYFEAVAAARADLIPVVVATDEMRAGLDLTLPIDSARLTVLVRKDDDAIETLGDLASARVGAFPDTALLAAEQGFAAGALVPLSDFDALAAALDRGEIDAILETADGLDRVGLSRRYRSIGAPGFEVLNAIGLRPGLGGVRERLNAVIPGYLASEPYAALRRRYFGSPVFWTSGRLYAAGSGLGVLVLGMLGALIWQRQAERTRAYERQKRALAVEQAHSKQLGDLVAQLQQSNREQGEFTYAISHDLKSPSNTMGILIEELKEIGGFGAEATVVLRDMSRTNHRMRQLVDDVLAYSRLIGKDVAPEPVDLNVVIEEVRQDLAGEITAAGANIEAAEMPVIDGNRMQLRMLMQNLIANAVKFRSPDRPAKVEISCRCAEDAINVVVADNGIGVPQEHRERIFGLFQRLNAGGGYEGTGLGLAICQRVMMNHRGGVSVGPGLEGGAAFTITFPGKQKETAR